MKTRRVKLDFYKINVMGTTWEDNAYDRVKFIIPLPQGEIVDG